MRQLVRDNVRMWPDSFRRTVVRDELAQAPPPPFLVLSTILQLGLLPKCRQERGCINVRRDRGLWIFIWFGRVYKLFAGWSAIETEWL
jgi:hypothetical protein